MARPARPRRLPLIGWSTAAQRFRELAESGELGDSVLIVGEPGVGKRTFAEAYKFYFRSRYKESLPIVPIDPRMADIPDRCIATTVHPPAYGRAVAGGRRAARVGEAGARHLDIGKRQPIPDEECGAEPLGDAVVARFAQTWYLPPLRRRLIDVLALLHFYGCRVFPKEGPSVRAVDSDLIHQLLLDRPWLGNAAGLLGFLRNAAEGGVLRRGDAVAFPPEIGLPKHLGHGRTDWDGSATWDGRCEVPFEALPKVGASIFAASFFIRSGDPLAEPLNHPFPHLGPSRLWATNPYWPKGVEPDRATSDDLIRAMAGPGGTAPLPQEFVEELSAFSAHGATVESLRSGFAVTPDSVPDELLRLILGKKARAARPPAKPKHGLTKAEKEICDLYAKLGYSQKAVAAHRNCSASAVSQAIKSAKAKLPPGMWERYYERRSKQYGKKVVGKRARMQSLPKDLADRKAYPQDLSED
jgi:DNA-binding CsgD family transcriptional regulator